MEAKEDKNIMRLNARGDVDVKDTAQMQRYMQQLLSAGTLPSHFKTVAQLWHAHAMLSAIGLDWRVCLKDCWINPTNGAMSLCNDAPLAACQKQPDYVATVEYHVNAKGERRTKDNFIGFKIEGAVCIAKRQGREDQEGLFTLDEARAANLLNKNNWKNFAAAMLRMRARAIALRAQWPDVLGGTPIREGDEGFENPPQARAKARNLVIDMLGDEVTSPSAPSPLQATQSPSLEQDAHEEEFPFERAPGEEEEY